MGLFRMWVALSPINGEMVIGELDLGTWPYLEKAFFMPIKLRFYEN